MTAYRYRARGPRGDLEQGELDAPSPQAVATRLMGNGLTPIQIVEMAPAPPTLTEVARQLRRRRKPSVAELALLCRQMHSLLKAGVPLVGGVRTLWKSLRNEQLQEVLQELATDLESGQDLSSSFGRHRAVFSPIFISMVRVGEQTGRLDQAFARLSEYLERDRQTRQNLNSALRYPVIVLASIAIAIVIINIYVIPAFADVFEQSGIALPWATMLLLNISKFMSQNWIYLLASVAGLYFLATHYVNTEQGRYRVDGWKLRVPIVGGIAYRATLARFARTLSMALSAGVPMIPALASVAEAVDNEHVGERLRQMRDGIERGDTLSRTATTTNLFTPLVLQMLVIGEETGNVDDLLEEVADFYDREVEYDLKNLTSTMEPVLVVTVGVMVLVLALGVFLPLWDLAAGPGVR